jgi:hypothetical protein
MRGIALVLIGLSSLAWSEFTAQGGVVKDTETQLEWQNSYKKGIKELDWKRATAYCENLKLKGSGWRLPTKSELVSIVDRYENIDKIRTEDSGPALHKVFLDKNPTGFDYWTSTATEDEPNLRWGVNFKRGWAGSYTKYYGLKVRCVRGELEDNIPMAKLYGIVGKESKPFSEEKEGPIVILGEPNPTMVKPSTQQLQARK